MSDKNEPSEPTATWLIWANRMTAILAVVAALSSGRWGASNLQAILEQAKVNDTWAYYQANSIKESTAHDVGALARALGKSAANPEQKEAFDKLANELAARAQQKGQDKKKQYEQAMAVEMRRDRLVERGLWFEISFALLQLGVILCTVAAAARTRGAFFAALLFGLLGFATLVNGVKGYYHAPRSWYQAISEQIAGEEPLPATVPAS